jgi:hypothetical protein
MLENPVKLPPGVVQTKAPETESSTWLRDLGGRGDGYASWAWLKKRFGTPVEDHFKGHRLYIRVRPFDANGQWFRSLEQEFTADGARDAERYGFQLMQDEPSVQGFWVDVYLDRYWPSRGRHGERHDMPMLTLGRYERGQQTPNARGQLEPGQYLETRGVLGGAYRGRLDDRTTRTHAVVVDGDPPGREVRVLCRQPLENIADYYSEPKGHAAPPTCPRCLERWEKLQMQTNPRKRAPFMDGPRGTERELAKLRRDQDIVARQLRMTSEPDKVASLQERERDLQRRVDALAFPDHTPNRAAVHYVWLLDYRGVPLDTEGPYGPMSLTRAEQFARIGAQEGDHDRVVSIGDRVMSDGFEILRRYRRGTGERML